MDSSEPTGPNPSVYTRRQRFELLRGQLDVERASFISHWRDLNDYILTRRGRFQVTDSNKGDRRNLKIIDSTATFSARTLSSGMMSGVTSPARPWFRLTTPDPDLSENGNVKDWLHTVTERMQSAFIRSNLYNALPTLYSDMGVFGTSAMMVEEDDEDIIRCYPFPIGSYYLANDHKLRVRTFIRDFRMTVRQLAEQFGYKALSMASRSLYDSGHKEIWVNVVHVIVPNELYDVSKLESKHKPFAACYYERGSISGQLRETNSDTLLEEKGFDEFPVLAPRWAITGEDVYGTDCPGMTVLGDVKSLQTMRKRGAQAVEKQLNPPMVGPSSLRSVKASLLPGDITYNDADARTSGFRPVHETKINLGDLRQDAAEIRALIQRGFYEDLFLMLAYSDPNNSKQPITATEVTERQEEKLLALGPMLEQLNQDLLDPLIDRTFAIMVRKGLIPDPPQQLQGMPLKVEYISVMAQAQKAVGLAALERFSGFVTNLASAVPAVLDKVDTDQMIDEYADMTGVAPRIVIPDDKVQAIRAAKAQAAAQERASAMANQTSSTAKNLAQSPTGGKNALTDVLNSQTAPPSQPTLQPGTQAAA